MYYPTSIDDPRIEELTVCLGARQTTAASARTSELSATATLAQASHVACFLLVFPWTDDVGFKTCTTDRDQPKLV